MAVTATFPRIVHQEAIVKVAGTPATTPSATVSLANDLVAAGQALAAGDQVVWITGLTWTGTAGAEITITRGGTVITTLQANAAGMLYFDGQTLPPEMTNATDDIVVTVSGGQAEVWLKLRKVSGWATKIEPATFGSYDDETTVGS